MGIIIIIIIKNLKRIVQSTAVTVQRKLKIRKRKRKEICLQFRETILSSISLSLIDAI